jgi:hypothetical protein
VIDPALIDQVATSQQKVADWIRQHATGATTAARPGAWSVRDVAAHLAACEVECLEPRIRAIASGSRPSFAFYSNDDRDFSAVDLEVALMEWSAARSRLLEFVQTLSGEQLTSIGQHATFGEVTVPAYLEIALEHDLGHLRDLERETSEPAS